MPESQGLSRKYSKNIIAPRPNARMGSIAFELYRRYGEEVQNTLRTTLADSFD